MINLDNLDVNHVIILVYHVQDNRQRIAYNAPYNTEERLILTKTLVIVI